MTLGGGGRGRVALASPLQGSPPAPAGNTEADRRSRLGCTPIAPPSNLVSPASAQVTGDTVHLSAGTSLRPFSCSSGTGSALSSLDTGVLLEKAQGKRTASPSQVWTPPPLSPLPSLPLLPEVQVIQQYVALDLPPAQGLASLSHTLVIKGHCRTRMLPCLSPLMRPTHLRRKCDRLYAAGSYPCAPPHLILYCLPPQLWPLWPAGHSWAELYPVTPAQLYTRWPHGGECPPPPLPLEILPPSRASTSALALD